MVPSTGNSELTAWVTASLGTQQFCRQQHNHWRQVRRNEQTVPFIATSSSQTNSRQAGGNFVRSEYFPMRRRRRHLVPCPTCVDEAEKLLVVHKYSMKPQTKSKDNEHKGTMTTRARERLECLLDQKPSDPIGPGAGFVCFAQRACTRWDFFYVCVLKVSSK